MSGKGKGIAGGVLLGAEVVTMVESIAGLRGAGWYIAGALVGGAGGGVGGYFVEKKTTDGRAPTYMMAGGMALLIPALVLTLNANRYRPTEPTTEDNAPTNTPPADPGTTGGKSASRSNRRDRQEKRANPVHEVNRVMARAPEAVVHPNLVNVNEGKFRVGIPMPNVVPVFTDTERQQYGVKQATEVKMPVVNVRF